MRRSTAIDDAFFNFRIAGQLAVGGGAYMLLSPCGMPLTLSTSWRSPPELLACLALLVVVWLVVANVFLTRHYQRVTREHHRCTKERIELGVLNSLLLVFASALVVRLVFGNTALPFSVAYVSSLTTPIYVIWQGSVWWREANRMDRTKQIGRAHV